MITANHLMKVSLEILLSHIKDYRIVLTESAPRPIQCICHDVCWFDVRPSPVKKTFKFLFQGLFPPPSHFCLFIL